MNNKAYSWFKGRGHNFLSSVGYVDGVDKLSAIGPFSGRFTILNLSTIGKTIPKVKYGDMGVFTIGKIGIDAEVLIHNYQSHLHNPSQIGVTKRT